MELAAAEVVPAAVGAHLDHVAVELIVFLGKFVEFTGLGNTPAVRGAQPVAVDVQNVEEVLALTDRAPFPHSLTNVAGRSEELRVRIADVVAADSAQLEIPQDGPAGKLVVGASDHAEECRRGRARPGTRN